VRLHKRGEKEDIGALTLNRGSASWPGLACSLEAVKKDCTNKTELGSDVEKKACKLLEG